MGIGAEGWTSRQKPGANSTEAAADKGQAVHLISKNWVHWDWNVGIWKVTNLARGKLAFGGELSP